MSVASGVFSIRQVLGRKASCNLARCASLRTSFHKMSLIWLYFSAVVTISDGIRVQCHQRMAQAPAKYISRFRCAETG
jgi:hypothetical protein